MTTTPKDHVDALTLDEAFSLARSALLRPTNPAAIEHILEVLRHRVEASARALAAVPADEQLSELMRGLEIPPSAATLLPAALYAIGRAIADQAKSAQQAGGVPAGWHEAVQRLVTGFEHVSGIARQWEPDHSSGADRAKWARATEACADVAKLLAAAPSPSAVQPLSEAQRVPLTDEQVRKWWASENGLEDLDMCNTEDFRTMVRAVEKKHGIVTPKEPT